jgi:hypothetical protein
MVILVLDSLIFWDHSYPSNQFILSYILSEFSWKRLRKETSKQREARFIGELVKLYEGLMVQQLGDSNKFIKGG